MSPRVAISQENLDVSIFIEDDDDDIVMDGSIIKSGISTINSRSLAALKYIPFAVPFMHRVRVSDM